MLAWRQGTDLKQIHQQNIFKLRFSIHITTILSLEFTLIITIFVQVAFISLSYIVVRQLLHEFQNQSIVLGYHIDKMDSLKTS